MPDPSFYTPQQHDQMNELENLHLANNDRLVNRYLDPAAQTMRQNVDSHYEEFLRTGHQVDWYQERQAEPRDQAEQTSFHANSSMAEATHVQRTNEWLTRGLGVERAVQSALNTHEHYGMDRIQSMVVVTPSAQSQGAGNAREASSRARPSGQSSSQVPSQRSRGRR